MKANGLLRDLIDTLSAKGGTEMHLDPGCPPRMTKNGTVVDLASEALSEREIIALAQQAGIPGGLGAEKEGKAMVMGSHGWCRVALRRSTGIWADAAGLTIRAFTPARIAPAAP